MHWGISLCLFNFLWKLQEQKFPQNGMPNFRKFYAKLNFACWKILVNFTMSNFCLIDNFLLSGPHPQHKMGENTGKIYHISRKKTRTQERTFSSHRWYWMRHLSYHLNHLIFFNRETWYNKVKPAQRISEIFLAILFTKILIEFFICFF